MSLSLQANWQDQSFYVWARVGAENPPVDAAILRAAVGEVCSDALLASTVAEGSFALSLPAGRAPQAERQNEDAGGVATHVTAGVEVVRVPALVLNPAEAIDFLTSLPRELPAVCGPSVAYWATLARFMCRLIATRQFMPRLETGEDDSLSACWRLLVSDRAPLEWLEKFATPMPPVCPAS